MMVERPVMQVPKRQLAAMALLCVLNAADVVSTHHGIQSGALREDNPLMVFVAEHLFLMVFVKATILSFAWYAIRRLSARNTLLEVTLLLCSGWYMYVIYLNTSLLLEAGVI